MYMFSNGLLPDVFNTLYIKNCEIHTYSTRSKDLYHVLPGTQTFSNISAKIWNSLIPCSFMVESSRVESRTVLPIVINKFKPKYAEQKLLGLH